MSSMTRAAYAEKISSLTEAYKQQGYTVIPHPSKSDVPFDLGGYRPDLIATRGQTGVMVEVKTMASHVSVDRLQSIAQEVSKHPGWRFLLVTLEDVDSLGIPTTSGELPSWEQLNSKLKQAQILIEDGAIEPAVLYLWSIFESALRKRAIVQSIPVERLPASKLLNHMYSQGEVSVEHLDLLRGFMEKRNRIAHGANEASDRATVSAFLESVSRLVTEWGAENSA